ncbi:hypothetical protein B0H14DRAFT_2577527 [Mycena olivaceomarginata]|nr:hypothetical protein B0H14DRAFT_2577527 [Mycena olivaceomarginata]
MSIFEKKYAKRTYESTRAGDKLFPINSKIPAFMYPKNYTYDKQAKQVYQGLLAALQALAIIAEGQEMPHAMVRMHLPLQHWLHLHTALLQPLNFGCLVPTQQQLQLSRLLLDFYWFIINLFQGKEGQGILDSFN